MAKEKIKEIPGAKRVKNLDTGEIFNSMSEAARKYGISITTITNSCKTGGKIATGSSKEKWHWVFM